MRFMMIVKADTRTEAGVLPTSKAEALDWARRIPFEHIPGDGRVPEVEVRQFFEESDFK